MTQPNIQNPAGFAEKLGLLMQTTHELIEICREHELAPYSENGCMHYEPGGVKCSFQAAGQFDRPDEFLASLLDMIRVNFEPDPLGTFLLNSMSLCMRLSHRCRSG